MPETMFDGSRVSTRDEARNEVMAAARVAAGRGLHGQPFGNPYYDLWANVPRPEKSVWGIHEALLRRTHATGLFA